MTISAPLWTTDEVVTATNGQVISGPQAWYANGVSIDSRTCEPGDLFVSISGDQFDGHDFVAGALQAGAAAAIVTRTPVGVPTTPRWCMSMTHSTRSNHWDARHVIARLPR